MADKMLVMHNMSMVRVLMSGYYMAIYSAKVMLCCADGL